MGCYTVYVIRDAAGVVRSAVSKWGSYNPASPAELDELIHRAHGSPRPHDFGPWLCRGLSVDFLGGGAPEVRFYACLMEMHSPNTRWIRETEAALSAALGPAFRVGYAWGRVHELAALANAPCSPEVLADNVKDAAEALFVTSREAADLTWNPEARVLRYPCWNIPEESAWVSIIAEDGRVHDVGLRSFPALPYLLASGPATLERLQREIPTPLSLRAPDEHAIFDCRHRHARLWSAEACSPREGWQGWTFERMKTDIGDHLALLGRRLDEDGVIHVESSELACIAYEPFEPT